MKNDNIKSDWKKYTITQKISFVLIVLIFALLILGSVGGLLYLFKPKKVNADEFIGGTTEGTLISSAIVPFPVEYYLYGGYEEYPDSPLSSGTYIFSYPFIFSTQDFTLSLSAYSSSGYSNYSLPASVGSSITVPLYTPYPEYNVLFSFTCTSSTLSSNSFGVLYSVLFYYTYGTNVKLYFDITNIDGQVITYSLEPYRADEFGGFEFNYVQADSSRWLIIANSNVNFTERLNQAKEQSFNNGYNQGYTDGKDYGYNVGYNQGVNDTDKFTFSSLLNAIFYAPLKAFISILNFEILGVNVLNIISFLFTMILALGIIRWVL